MSQAPENYSELIDRLPTYFPTPKVSGSIRSTSQDFEVTEVLSFEPAGEGEHLFLLIEKIDCNTDWVGEVLRKHFQLRTQDIGYAGKKDRYSVSRQWFSLHIPGKEVSTEGCDNVNFKILKTVRHNRKLRKGAISHNQFKITVRNLSGPIDSSSIEGVRTVGFPNYFGYQRFGRNAANLSKANQLFSGQIRVRSRNQRGLYLSAARSLLFNLQVAARIEGNSWNKAVAGDCLNLNNSQSYFYCSKPDDEIVQRLSAGEIHISGWLAGRQNSQVQDTALELEQRVLEPYADWLDALNSFKLDSARRAIRAIPEGFHFETATGNSAIISFSLPGGCFATSLLRELFIVQDLGIQEFSHD